jgi:glutamine---fructose-6-phosphate transaminase (isomerizing)
MCGIVGYIGKQRDIKVGLAALKRLEYRGYDSAGLAVFDSGKNQIIGLKSIGRIDDLENKIAKSGLSLDGNPSLFHTRWATHGGVTEANAHPHSDCKGNIWLVHNGIIENHKELRESLEKEGHKFVSETDTEVVAHLIEKFFDGNLEEAVRKAVRLIRGAYALAIIAKDDPQKLVAARLSSPLVIGISANDGYIVASDATAVVPYAKQVVNLEDNEIAVINHNDFYILKEKQPEDLEIEAEDIQKGGYPHYMLKEIMEQPEALENSLKGRLILDQGLAQLGGLQNVSDQLRKIKRLRIVACGTAYHAGLIGKYMMEEYAGIPTEVDIASEFRYRKPILEENTALLCISQSGETADTLAAIQEAKRRGVLTLGIVNAIGSSIVRETDAGVYNHIGPEIGVAATKSFVSQLAILALLTLYLGRQRNLSLVKGQRIAADIQKLPGLVAEILKQNDTIKEVAEKYKDFSNGCFIGRKYNAPIALEGALKLKEISYLHAEGVVGGELKHGPLALVDENFLTVAICPSDSVYEKMVSNIQQVKGRNGKVIAIATEGNEDIKNIVDDVIYIPRTSEILTPILSVVPLQLFAYHVGVLKGCDVDKPRNLAKSVTVE